MHKSDYRIGDIRSLKAFQSLFSLLNAPDPEWLNGRFRAEFVGPKSLQAIAPRLLPLGGLPGWCGKAFVGDKQAVNLLSNGSQVVEAVPMLPAFAPSQIDQRQALVLRYDQRAPLACRKLVDELRVLDETSLLGLTMVDLPLLRKLVMPFVLKRWS